MSDFVSSGWSWWVIAITVGGLVFCVWLLFVSSRTTQMSDDGTTGHVWDENLREMNNPLPRWWLWLFIITVVFAGLYLYLYPGLGSAEGSLKWTSSGQLAAEKEAANAKLQPVFARYVAMDAAQLAQERGDGDGPAPVHQQLCAVPWIRRPRQQGFPEPDRQRLAARWLA